MRAERRGANGHGRGANGRETVGARLWITQIGERSEWAKLPTGNRTSVRFFASEPVIYHAAPARLKNGVPSQLILFCASFPRPAWPRHPLSAAPGTPRRGSWPSACPRGFSPAAGAHFVQPLRLTNAMSAMISTLAVAMANAVFEL